VQRLVRPGLGLLCGLYLWWGLWAWTAPRHFFDTFPGLGHHWTAGYPPYNEHLVADLGASFLTLALLTGVAAAIDDRRVRWTVLAAVGVFNLLHLSFHAAHAGRLTGLDFAVSVVALALGVLAPVLLWLLDRIR
jgi:hypothetical protein